MPEEVIKMEYEKIKDIHIKFPTMEQIKTGNFELPEISNNEVSTRRKIDFSDSKIEGIAVSLEDIKGAIINQFQAIDLLYLIGVKIK